MESGNRFLTKTGDLLLPKPVLHFLEYYYIGNDTSLFYISNWTVVHFLSGILTAHLIIKYLPTYQLYLTGFYTHTLWELYQVAVRNTRITTARGFVDMIVDTMFFMIGMVLYGKCMKVFFH